MVLLYFFQQQLKGEHLKLVLVFECGGNQNGEGAKTATKLVPGGTNLVAVLFGMTGTWANTVIVQAACICVPYE